ncbi:MAG: Gfo/Idh/MocA family oxidoreductase [Flavobacteriales bacterium]|nr:Gfo/Idh/MocA family oxidoreductase [Flavobacteriales bacterium]MCB9197473.1 Gfo/Idh/MocA family oxidoreductase [Flavobacteriales bacterium]
MLKIGVIGAGHLGKIHIRILKQANFVELVGFYDASAETRDLVSKEFGLRAYDDLDELIQDVNIVDIVTPTITHFDIAQAALRSFKHVFIEKPITSTVEESTKLIRLATEANVKVQVGHVERFNPAFIAVKDELSEPMFIETHRLAQFNPRGTDVSVVLDLMIHDIDVILSVVKSNVKNIAASGVAVLSDTPDIANARIEFDNGCVANITASRMSMKNMRKARFFQKDAYVAVDFLNKEKEVIKMKDVSEAEVDPFALTIDLGEKGMKQIDVSKEEVAQTNAIEEELRSFVYAIENDLEPPVSINDGDKALRVALEIMKKINI